MRFEFSPVEGWPPLAWLARCPIGGDAIEVRHGNRVEVGPEWFCEAVWPGEFQSGDFDRTDLVFGSGARIRDGGVTFVSAGSTVDRLQSFEHEGALWVSNSLVCILAAVGAEFDPTYTAYTRHFQSVIRGLQRYERTLATSAGPLRLTYFNNLLWDGQRATETEKPNPVRDFSCYGSYRSFLEDSVGGIAANLAAGDRKHPYKMLGTISSGYDSPTVAVLGRVHGLREVISFDRARGGGTDSGRTIAEIVGLETRSLSSEAWRERDFREVPFLAVHGNAADIWYAGAEGLLSGRVLMTGYHGDKVWAKEVRNLGPNIVRGDLSGLSLSEYRLWIGFIHWPVPFMGVRQLREINAISGSDEMEPWDVPGGYSRPICRRAVEEAGVPRGVLAPTKRYGSVRLSDRSMFWTTQVVSEYTKWLRQRSGLWLANRRVPPLWFSRAVRPFQPLAAVTARSICRATGGRLERNSAIRRLEFLGTREYVYKFLFPWAVEEAKKRYTVG